MKNKLERFRVVAERENVLQAGKDLYFQVRGKWNELYFKNENPITVELACGRGEYSVNLAEKFPEQNFIGVDVKGDRLWKGSSWAVERKLNNVGFLRADVLGLATFFDPGEISELWITFPDPRPRKRDIKRRLTGNRYFTIYKPLVKRTAWVRFKTDNTALFDFTLEELSTRNDVLELQYTQDLYASDLRSECFDIRTRYEEMFTAEGETIKYLRFRFDHSVSNDSSNSE
jgi:tRNA (guanine-N7-)-methyltransferase